MKNFGRAIDIYTSPNFVNFLINDMKTRRKPQVPNPPFAITMKMVGNDNDKTS